MVQAYFLEVMRRDEGNAAAGGVTKGCFQPSRGSAMGSRFTMGGLVTRIVVCTSLVCCVAGTTSGSFEAGTDPDPSDLCKEWSVSIGGWRYCSDNSIRAKASSLGSDRCSPPVDPEDVLECEGALIAEAKLNDEWSILTDPPAPPELRPGDDGWCGSYWDTCCGDEVFNKYCNDTREQHMSTDNTALISAEHPIAAGNILGTKLGSSDRCNEWSMSKYGWKFCSGESVQAKAAMTESPSCTEPISPGNLLACKGALIAQAKISDEWTILATEPPPPKLEPGDIGWCGSYWDACCGDEVFYKHCSGNSGRRLGMGPLAYLARGLVINDDDPHPEWAIYHMRKAEAFSSPAWLSKAEVYGQTDNKCEGSTKGRPYVKGAQLEDVLVGYTPDTVATDMHVHIHDIQHDIYLAEAIEVNKLYPCSEVQCGVAESPNGSLRVFVPEGKTRCSIWVQPTLGMGGIGGSRIADMVTTTMPQPLCTDRDCALRKSTCSYTGCKRQAGADGVCRLVSSSCT